MNKVIILAFVMLVLSISLSAVRLNVEVLVGNGGPNCIVRYTGEYYTPQGLVTFDKLALRNRMFGGNREYSEPFQVPEGQMFYVTITATKTLPNGTQLVDVSGGQTRVVDYGTGVQLLTCAPIVFPY